LILCHLDHRLRGAAGRADSRFVERLAKRMGLAVVLGSSDVAARARQRRQSIELAAREARYEFFARVARARRCRTLFLAHHADDRVETFLINLFRGAGPAGLAAMRKESERPVAGTTLRLVRPLLSVWRKEIDEYVALHRIKFREDASNQNEAFLRNRIRRRVIPDIEREFGRAVRATLWRTADILALEEAWLSQPAVLGDLQDQLDVRGLRTQPVALQRRIIAAWLRAHGATGIGYDEVENIRALLPTSAPRAKTNLPGGLHVRRRAGKLFLQGKERSARTLGNRRRGRNTTPAS
jgi:tRNA(Ile)-lysidine synthase